MVAAEEIEKTVEEERADLADAIEALLLIAMGVADRHERALAERERVNSLIRRDIETRAADARRGAALDALEMGDDSLIADTVLGPTPEQMRGGDFITRRIGGKKWTDRNVTGFRRMVTDQLVVLHSRGVLRDDTFKACKWYRDRYQAAQMEAKTPVAGYGETVRGDPVYGHLPSTEWAAEARSDIRWANGFIPVDLLKMFQNVICYDYQMRDAAKIAHMRYRNFSAAFKLAAERLCEGVSSRLNLIG